MKQTNKEFLRIYWKHRLGELAIEGFYLRPYRKNPKVKKEYDRIQITYDAIYVHLHGKGIK